MWIKQRKRSNFVSHFTEVMRKVYAGAGSMITSLGFTIDENIEHLKTGQTGLKITDDPSLWNKPFPASLIDSGKIKEAFSHISGASEGPFTMLEQMHLVSIQEVFDKSNIDPQDGRTLLILSTTKGNIDLLDPSYPNDFAKDRLYLWKEAAIINDYFNIPNQPLVISNACISGVVGIIVGARLIRSGRYDHVIISGGDILTEFVVSGFMSFQSLSSQPCKPFDVNRDGLSLGEGVGTLILSAFHDRLEMEDKIIITGGSSSNDANHISGPSRTGEGLYIAIKNAIREAGLSPQNIDYISAHGTATDYNDEMEAKAIVRAGLQEIPLNSLKGYIGHTLGAAGTIESIVALESMRRNELYETAGYREHGVSGDIKVINKFEKKNVNRCLKAASGFGGCNAAVIFEKAKVKS